MDNRRTLVLAVNYQPIGHVSWRKAISNYIKGRCEILEMYDEPVRAGKHEFQMPAVIRFLTKIVAKMFSRHQKFNRHNVWSRDRSCQYCGDKTSMRDFTYDHVIPRRLGGKTTWNNIVVCCLVCNQKKGGRTLHESGMTLLRTPVAPKALPSFDLTHLFGDAARVPELWRDWLKSVHYWGDELMA